MMFHPMLIVMFVHLVSPPLFFLWSWFCGGDPSREDGTVAGTGAKRHWIYTCEYTYRSPEENDMGTSRWTTSPHGQTGDYAGGPRNSWPDLMQQHAARSVPAEINQLPTRPGLWTPAPKETEGNLRGL